MLLEDTEIQELMGTFNDYVTKKTCGALSTLLGEPIEHKLSIIDNDVRCGEDGCCKPDTIKMCSVRLNGKGDLHIELLYTVKLNHGIQIASKLLGTEVHEIDEMGTSALQEVANILTGSFFNALSENTGFRVDLSTPVFKEGALQDLLSDPVCEITNPTNDAIITDVTLCGKNTGIEIHMLIIEHPEHARKLISGKNGISEEPKSKTLNDNLIGDDSFAIDTLLADFDSEVLDAVSPQINSSNSEIDSLLSSASSQADASNSEIDSLLKKVKSKD